MLEEEQSVNLFKTVIALRSSKPSLESITVMRKNMTIDSPCLKRIYYERRGINCMICRRSTAWRSFPIWRQPSSNYLGLKTPEFLESGQKAPIRRIICLRILNEEINWIWGKRRGLDRRLVLWEEEDGRRCTLVAFRWFFICF